MVAAVKKSAELRIAQAKESITAYESAGLGDDRNCRFVKDMLRRLEAGKGLSQRQRSWFDSIIEQGVPAPKGDPDLIKRLQACATVVGLPDSEARVLVDFAGRISRGWDLSEKQLAWVEKILVRAEHIKANGPWVPDAAVIKKLKYCAQLERGYSSIYWMTHVGALNALNKVHKFLSGETSVIDEWTVNKVFKAMSRPLRELENPKFNIGEMCWCRLGTGGKVPALVAAGPYVNASGVVVYDVLVDGVLVGTSTITKRR